MKALDKDLRSALEKTVKAARTLAETAAQPAVDQLEVGHDKPEAFLGDAEKAMRNRLRTHGKQLGDARDSKSSNPTYGKQEVQHLVQEMAYQHWHRMLFARFLADNNLLMYDGVAVTIGECDELAPDEGATNGWELAGKLAARMLPQIFKPRSPVFALTFAPEHQRELERLFAGVCDLEAMPVADQMVWMKQVPVGEVWGIGRRISERLAAMNIHTVSHLVETDPKALRKQFGVVVERTANELRGLSCLALEEVAPAKQQIIASRSFGAPVRSLSEISEAVSWHIDRAANKLRAQGSVAATVYVFVETNRFKPIEPQYSAGLMVPLVAPTDNTFTLTDAALAGLRRIYRAGYTYKKCGVMLVGISDTAQRQGTLLLAIDDAAAPNWTVEPSQAQRERSAKTMSVMDAINARWGRGTARSSATGVTQRWAMRSENRSPRYTTRWDELPVAR